MKNFEEKNNGNNDLNSNNDTFNEHKKNLDIKIDIPYDNQVRYKYKVSDIFNLHNNSVFTNKSAEKYLFKNNYNDYKNEKYDINNNEWTVLPNLSFKQIYPVLYVHNDILYSFFGIDEHIKKSDNIQKLNIKNPRGKWQKVNYKRNKCNLCVYGCGIAKINENCVLFLGGMDDNGIRDDAIQFDFSNLTAKKTDFLLEEKAYFKDSILLRLSQKDFGNFSIEDTNPFLKIKFQVNVKKMTP